MQDSRKPSAKLSTGSLLGLVGLALTGLAAVPARAGTTTLNFDNFTSSAEANGGLVYVGSNYDTQGFTLTSGLTFFAVAGTDPTLGDGETSLYTNGGAPVTLTQDNGKAFAFSAIDLGPFFGNSRGTNQDGQVMFTGTRADGSTVMATDTTTSATYQTFSFTGFTDLQSLTFRMQGGSSLFDNVVLTPAPVPEASSTVSLGLMLALGLGGVVVMRRKKSVQA